MRTPSLRTIVLIASAAVSTVASAHLGTDAGVHHSFLDGLVHPLTGMDHMAAMVAVGLWSALSATSARRVWLTPIAFAGMLLVGALLGLGGLALPAVSTIGLHLAGVGIGLAMRSHSAWWPRVVGGLVTLLGGAFLLQLV